MELGCGCSPFPGLTESLSEALSIWPALFGGVFFSFGAYLMCLESMFLGTRLAEFLLACMCCFVGGVRGMEKRGHFDGLPSTPHRNVMRGRDTWKTNLFNLPSALVPLSADQAPWWCEGYIVIVIYMYILCQLNIEAGHVHWRE